MSTKIHLERWERSIGAGSGAKATEAPPSPAPYTPALLQRIWALRLDSPAWHKADDLWPCVLACQAANFQDPEIVRAQQKLEDPRVLVPENTNIRRFLRAVAAYLQKERR